MKTKLEVREEKRKGIADVLIQNFELSPTTIYNFIEVFDISEAVIEIMNLDKKSQLLSEIENLKLKYVTSLVTTDIQYVDVALLCANKVPKDILCKVLDNQPESITIFGVQSKLIKWEDFLYNMNKIRFKKLIEHQIIDLLFAIHVDENVINLSFSTAKYKMKEIFSKLQLICSFI